MGSWLRSRHPLTRRTAGSSFRDIGRWNILPTLTEVCGYRPNPLPPSGTRHGSMTAQRTGLCGTQQLCGTNPSEEQAMSTSPQAIDPVTAEEVAQSNATGRTPVVFIHGLWLLPSSWDRWTKVFEDNGYAALTPGWPDDPDTVEEANAHPEVFAHKTVGQVADHYAAIIDKLERETGRDRALVRRSADPDPRWTRPVGGLRGDRPRPLPRRAAPAGLGAEVRLPGPGQPRQPQPGGPADLRAVPVRASPTPSAKTRRSSCTRPSRYPHPVRRIFQAAGANLNPWTEAKVTARTPTAARC